jgi:glycerophosphoryl diester phosphodiesterase
MFQRIVLGLVLLLATFVSAMAAEQTKTIIYKDTSAGSYSLPQLILASLQHPDFIELPIVLSRDNIPVVFDDLFLYPKTNIADIFPERSRSDGKYYTIDFTLAELEQLSYAKDAQKAGITRRISSLDDTLVVISELNTRIDKHIDILALVKYPWFHANEVYDISNSVLKTLIAHSSSADTQLYLKCYDPDELQRIKKDLLPGLPVQVQLIQAIDSEDGNETMRMKRGRWIGYNYEWIFTRLGLRVVSGYAAALALQDVERISESRLKSFIADSQGLKLQIFIDTAQLVPDEQERYLNRLFFELNADGLSTSNPGELRKFLDSQQTAEGENSEIITPIQQEDSPPPALLSDPEKLLERLKNIQ